MADPKIVEEWLAKGDEDFEFASLNLRADHSFFAQICFHFHQAAEKYLKAFIIAYDLEFRKIHELPLLLKICRSHDPSLINLQDNCEYLDAFYLDTRYPVHWPTNYSKDVAQSAFQASSKIRDLIKEKLRRE